MGRFEVVLRTGAALAVFFGFIGVFFYWRQHFWFGSEHSLTETAIAAGCHLVYMLTMTLIVVELILPLFKAPSTTHK